MFRKIINRPASLGTVDVNLKTLTDHGYVNQETAPWSKNGKAQVTLYSLGNKGREFLNRKK